jgi:predicted DNA-binding antitoxin AbrB/MazE fold protein
MTITVRALYENGVLRPMEPLALAEGDTVYVTVATTESPGPIARAPSDSEQEYVRRVKAAQTLDELLALMGTAPPLPGGFDLCDALNANRKAMGERLLFPEPDDGTSS